MAFAFIPPAINGLGVSGGFQMQLQDRGRRGLRRAPAGRACEIVADGDAQSGLQALNTTFRARVPQLFADVDRTKAKTWASRSMPSSARCRHRWAPPT